MDVLRENTMAALKEVVSGKTKGWIDANSAVENNKANKHGCGTGINECISIEGGTLC
jgi:hypothetical protein